MYLEEDSYIRQIKLFSEWRIKVVLYLHKIRHTYPRLTVNLLKPTFHVMHQQFNIQQLYVLPTLYLCVLYLSENKQQLVQLTA